MEKFSTYSEYLGEGIIKYYKEKIEGKNNHSLNSDNFENYFNMIYSIINDYWENFFKKIGKRLISPKLIINYSKKLDKESKLVITYSIGKNEITIHKDVFLKFLGNIVINDITFIAIIAHEFGHVLQGQIGIMKTEKEKEYGADFISGYTIKILNEKYGIFTKEDLNNILIDFENSGNITEIFCQSNGINNIHGNGKKRKYNFNRGLKANENDIIKYLKGNNHLERIMHILLS